MTLSFSPRRLRSALRVGAVVALACATLTTSLTGCAPTAPTLDSVGTIRAIDGGTSMTVPALWAGSTSDGTEVGGIEPTEVKVYQHRDGVPEVDLTAIDVAGAGPLWRVATEQAAAVATLLSARDPREIDLGFTVTGPIDGPSAGGILTVGILASLTKTPLLKGVTMTGTISPDGSIGEVGGVPTKLKAALDAGYTTVVVPEGSYLGTNADGSRMTNEQFAASSPLTVVQVRNVMQAYKVLTGVDYVYEPAVPVSPSPSSEAAMHETTTAMVTHLQDAIASAPAGTDSAAIDLGTQALASMQDAIVQHDLPRAYGLGTFALLRVARASGAALASASIATNGLESARSQLVDAVASSRADAQAVHDDVLADLPSKLEQVVYLPSALGWTTYALAAFDGVTADLKLAQTDEALLDAARVIAEAEVGVRVMQMDALTVLRAMPSTTSLDTAQAQGFLDGYATLLRRAGDANADYYQTLSGQELRADGRFNDDAMSASVAKLRDSAAAASGSTSASLSESVDATATAMSYFVLSNGLLASAQAYGISIDDADLRSSGSAAVLETAVDTSAMTVETFAEQLRLAGYTVGEPLWSSRWGTAAAVAYRSTPNAANAAWVGLNESWYDSVSLFMLTALVKPTSPAS